MKLILGTLAFVAAAIFAVVFHFSSPSSAMRVEDNAVVVNDQRPGNAVTIAQVHLAVPGYVVVKEPGGKNLGASALLPAGTSSNIRVALMRASKEAETLHAVLYVEKGGDRAFQEGADAPVGSRLGGPIMGTFMISSSASEAAGHVQQ